MKILALTGGGCKGSYQLGALRKLLVEEDQNYDAMVGVSVGALHVAALSQVHRSDPNSALRLVENFWLNEIRTSNVHKRWFPLGKVHGLWRTSLYDSSPLRETFESFFDPRLAMNCGRQIAVGAMNMTTGKSFYARETNSRFVDYTLASASFPVFFTPIEIDGHLWSDGGVKEVTPLGQAIKMGATHVDLILTDHEAFGGKLWASKKRVAFPHQLVRTIELMQHRMLKRDIEITKLKNKLSLIDDRFRHVNVRILVPSEHLTDRTLSFERDDIKRMMEIGYRDAANMINLD